MLFNRIHHEFTTSIPAERVTEQIRMRLPSGRFRADSEFFGYVTENSFKIMRDLRYNVPLFSRYGNPFAPVVMGRFEKSDSGTTIKLKLRLHLMISVFILVWELFLGFCLFGGILECILGSFGDGVISVLTSVLLACAIELLLLFFFRLPAKRFIERLEEILKYD